jgi:hypothetical protein
VSRSLRPALGGMRNVTALLALVLAAPWLTASSEFNCPSPNSTDYYFRGGTFRKDDSFVRGWYSKQLAAMKEPSLSCGPTQGTEFRFTWLRTFHHPIAVRVANKGDGDAELVAVELDGAGGYDPGKELHRLSRSISAAEWLKIKSLMEHWALQPDQEQRGFDGSEWLFEARTSNGYRAVAVWTPTSGAAREAGQLFLATAGITVPAKEMY